MFMGKTDIRRARFGGKHHLETAGVCDVVVHAPLDLFFCAGLGGQVSFLWVSPCKKPRQDQRLRIKASPARSQDKTRHGGLRADV